VIKSYLHLTGSNEETVKHGSGCKRPKFIIFVRFVFLDGQISYIVNEQ